MDVKKINGYDIVDAGGRTLIDEETAAREGADTALGTRIDEETVKMISTTWAELKALRDGGKLVAGMQYRITDYVTTTVQSDTRSAGHAFDIIVTADGAGVLSEDARAALHEGDTYFASAKLEAWKLKYCLDNDTARFAWADAANGKGVIWRMVDEKENDLPYDFKNVQFKRWRVTKYLVNEAQWATGVDELNKQIASVPSLRWGNYDSESAEDAIDDNSATWWSSPTATVTLSSSDTGLWKVDDEYDLFCLSDGTEKWFYTFSSLASDTAETADSSLTDGVYKNSFGYGQKSLAAVALGKNVLIGNYFSSNTVGNNFYYNTVGNYFSSNTVGNYFRYNTVGNNFYYNTVGNDFYSNTVGNYFYSNTVGNNFSSNTVGNNFSSNTVGNNFRYNHAEDGVQYVTLPDVSGGSSSNYVQKYRLLAGLAGTSSSRITPTLTRGNVKAFNIKQNTATTASVVEA